MVGCFGCCDGSGQVNAMLRKSATVQMKAYCTSICMLITPIIFCLMLFLLQMLVNSSLDTRENRCGCKCLKCIIDGSVEEGDACRDFNDYESCQMYDDDLCGIRYSDEEQAPWCAVAHPSSWPPIAQIPDPRYRAGRDVGIAYDFEDLNAVDIPVLWTGAERDTQAGLADKLYPVHEVDMEASAMACLAGNVAGDGLCGTLKEQMDLLADFEEGVEDVTLRGELFSQLGMTAASWSEVENLYTYYIEPGFIDDTTALTSSCADSSFVEVANDPTGIVVDQLLDSIDCGTVSLIEVSDDTAVNDALYCGFREARCADKVDDSMFEYALAYDFGDSDTTVFDTRIWTNQSSVDGDGGPTGLKRVNQPLAQAGSAWIKWVLGDEWTMRLNAVMSMPKPKTSLSLDFASLLGPIFYLWVLEMILPVSLYQMVYEKESRLRMMMKMHGLSDGAYWLITYLWYLLLYCAFALLLIIFGSITNLKFFRNNGYDVQLVFFFLFGNVQLAFTFLLSCLFKKARTAVVVAFLWVFGTGLLGGLLVEQLIERKKDFIPVVELIPAFGAYRGLYEFASYSFLAEYRNDDGLTFAKFSDADCGMGRIMWVFVLEWPIFMGLAWYLEKVLENGTGIRKHWLYCFKRNKNDLTTAPDHAADDVALNVDMQLTQDVEAETQAAMTTTDYNENPIVVRHLRKIFPAVGGNPPKTAVRDLSLCLKRGECFGLLGPNGAGKTTAINLMTGLLESTSGTAYVRGMNIATRADEVYRAMGVCPQHDLLWKSLTGIEHLLFYGRLKGLKGMELKNAVYEALRGVGLDHVGNVRAGRYSGGMKRRLSVAISLIGSSDVVYMDEPSTGLDPASRRRLWDVVKDAKRGRAIVLTTHSMEEASVLCDRLGIFVDGRLVCIGNPTELTTRHGGYLTFSMSVQPGEEEMAKELVKKMCNEANLTYEVNGTLKFELPSDNIQLSKIFAHMEDAAKAGEVHVQDWGVANATLEEVFIKLARAVGAKSHE